MESRSQWQAQEEGNNTGSTALTAFPVELSLTCLIAPGKNATSCATAVSLKAESFRLRCDHPEIPLVQRVVSSQPGDLSVARLSYWEDGTKCSKTQ